MYEIRLVLVVSNVPDLVYNNSVSMFQSFRRLFFFFFLVVRWFLAYFSL